jgi:hypothetical protein
MNPAGMRVSSFTMLVRLSLQGMWWASQGGGVAAAGSYSTQSHCRSVHTVCSHWS